MSEINIQAKDGSDEFMAYIAKPDVLPAPGIIVIQEIFGVNQNLRDICERWARRGYIAICPDLFWRQEPGIQLTDQTPEEWERAFELFGGFDVDKGVDDLDAALQALRGLEDCTGKVGNVGYCLGGKLSYLMAARTDIDCSVSYYGVGLDDLLGESDNIDKPLLMHIAEEDEYVSKEAQEKIKGELLGHNNVTIHSYPGVDHAFTRINGEHFNEAAAQIANDRTAEFVEQNLMNAAPEDEIQITNV